MDLNPKDSAEMGAELTDASKKAARGRIRQDRGQSGQKP